MYVPRDVYNLTVCLCGWLLCVWIFLLYTCWLYLYLYLSHSCVKVYEFMKNFRNKKFSELITHSRNRLLMYLSQNYLQVDFGYLLLNFISTSTIEVEGRFLKSIWFVSPNLVQFTIFSLLDLPTLFSYPSMAMLYLVNIYHQSFLLFVRC